MGRMDRIRWNKTGQDNRNDLDIHRDGILAFHALLRQIMI